MGRKGVIVSSSMVDTAKSIQHSLVESADPYRDKTAGRMAVMEKQGGQGEKKGVCEV